MCRHQRLGRVLHMLEDSIRSQNDLEKRRQRLRKRKAAIQGKEMQSSAFGQRLKKNVI